MLLLYSIIYFIFIVLFIIILLFFILYCRSHSSSLNQTQLNKLNNAANNVFAATLSICAYCGRKFNDEKLAIHNKSCTASNPARRIDVCIILFLFCACIYYS